MSLQLPAAADLIRATLSQLTKGAEPGASIAIERGHGGLFQLDAVNWQIKPIVWRFRVAFDLDEHRFTLEIEVPSTTPLLEWAHVDEVKRQLRAAFAPLEKG